MSAIVTRSNPANPDARQAGAAFGAILLALAVFAAILVGRQAGGQATTQSGTAPAAVMHDRGWSSASQPGALGVPAAQGASGSEGTTGTRQHR